MDDIQIREPSIFTKTDFPLRDDIVEAPVLDLTQGVTERQLRDHLHLFTAYFFDFDLADCPLEERLYTLELRYWAKDKRCTLDEVKYQYLFGEPSMGLDYGFTLWAYSEVILDSIGVDLYSKTDAGKFRSEQYESLFYAGEKMISHNHCSSQSSVGDVITWLVNLIRMTGLLQAY